MHMDFRLVHAPRGPRGGDYYRGSGRQKGYSDGGAVQDREKEREQERARKRPHVHVPDIDQVDLEY
jgi:hypothetical protein